jgi:dTDP-4-amino-4,6-dideoxygalactose transaminase
MLHGQHLSSPGPDILARWEESTPNFSLRMSALAAALLRPQLEELPRRAARWREIHDRIRAGLSSLNAVRLPRRHPDAVLSPTSVQFSLPGFDATEMKAVLAHALERGVPIKWFGASRQTGFTSAPRHWSYAGEQGPLEATHHVLSTLCDIRTPVSMTDEECDLTTLIVREAVNAALPAVVGRSETRPVG